MLISASISARAGSISRKTLTELYALGEVQLSPPRSIAAITGG